MRDTRPDYPPEYDDETPCEVCRRDESECECPECPHPDCHGIVGRLACYDEGHINKGNKAYTLAHLAAHLGTNPASIAKILFKTTECGITFRADAAGVEVCGYAEGSGDAACSPLRLDFPIDMDDFYAAVDIADREGCELWNESASGDNGRRELEEMGETIDPE